MLEAFQIYDGHILDVRKLMRMRGYLDAASFLEIIEDFEKALRDRLCRLNEDAPQGKDITHLCHDVLNIAGTLGMGELMSECERLRDKARESTSDPRTLSVPSLVTAGQRALAELQNYKAGGA